MPTFDPTGKRRGLPSALAASLAIHTLLLFLPHDELAGAPPAAPALQARLAPRPQPPAGRVERPARPSDQKASKAAARTRVIATDHAHRPQAQPAWTSAEKAEMDGFLNELAEQAQKTPPPTFTERSLAMARQAGQQLAREDAAAEALLELRPNAPPADPFSVDLYMEGLVRRLNRSAAFVNSGRRHPGVQTAAVQFRLNPDGSLKSFTVLNAADQADEVAFIRAVIERSLPFAPFPPDIDRAARSLGVTICIRPGRHNDPGFSRMRGNRCL